MLKKIKEDFYKEFGEKLKIRINEQKLDDFLDDLGSDEDEMLDSQVIIEIESDSMSLSVCMEEAFGCCGKAYMSGFSSITTEALELGEKYLFRVCELVARNFNYSYIGFVHQEGISFVEAGRSEGFSTAFKFLNKRSKNNLEEMFKILD